MLILGILCAIFTLTTIILTFKIIFLRRAVNEICTGFSERLNTETNTLITISSQDKVMRNLASSINRELRSLREDRHRYKQGDLELKEAVTNISHDLRTPLTAICGYLDLLENEEKSDEVNRYLEIIKERTDILKQLTEELFRYSYFMTVSDNATFENVIINNVLEESISAYYASLKGCGIVPEISISDTKIIRNLNKNALSRIFSNIISNAIKYSDGALNISLLEDGEIIFKNSAPKLDEIQTGKLFDRFFTVESGTKSTGLGLSIAKALTEQMHGKINACYVDGCLCIHVKFL